MASITAAVECKSFEKADEVRTFEKGRIEFIHTPAGSVARLTFEPGWRWSEHVKPLAGTDWCEVRHFSYLVSGRIHIAMQDGTEFDMNPGQVSLLEAGHDAWVVGDEPAVFIDWGGVSDYARGQ